MKLALVVAVALGLTVAWQASVVAEYQEKADYSLPAATADTSAVTAVVTDPRS